MFGLLSKNSALSIINPLKSIQNVPGISARFIDIALILDSSLSMQDNDPSEIRKQAALNLVNALYPEDRISIVEFADNANIICELTPNKQAAISAIHACQTKNEGTYIDKAMKTAVNHLATRANNNHRAIILFTDGGGRYQEKLNQMARQYGIKVFTVGLGSKINTYLLQSLALKTGGRYLHATQAHELLEIFQRLQKTLRIMAENRGQLLLGSRY